MISKACLVCRKPVKLTESEMAALNYGIKIDSKICDECKQAILYAKKQLEEAKDIAMPVERFDNYNHEWWAGYCPRCKQMIRFNYEIDSKEGNRKHYCFRCGQLCDFEDIEV